MILNILLHLHLHSRWNSFKKFGNFIDILFGHVFDILVRTKLPSKNGFGVLNEFLSGFVLRRTPHFGPSSMLIVILNIKNTRLCIIIITELRLLRQPVESKFLPLALQLVDVNGSVSKGLADKPVVVNSLLSVPIAIILMHQFLLFIPKGS